MIPTAGNKVVGTAAVLAAMALVVLDAGITNVALPTISGAFGIAPAKAVLVASAYQLALLMGLLPMAHVAVRTGSRKLFILGIITFTAASLLAALSRGFELLIAARFMQGIGGSAILALGIPLLRLTLGNEQLGRAIGWNALNVALCAAAAPAIGALVLGIADWRWLFLINLPVGLIALAAAKKLPSAKRRNGPVDILSIALHTASAACLFLAVEFFRSSPFAAVVLAGAAARGFAGLIRREASKAAPLLPLDLLRQRSFRLAVGASTLCFVAQSAGLIALPFYLQMGLGEGALATGMTIACWPLAVALTSPFANRLADRLSLANLCLIGAGILFLGLSAAGLSGPSGGAAALAACAAMCGIGFGLFQVPNNRGLFFAASEERSEAAGGVQGSARLAGQTAGGLIASLLFAAVASSAAPRLTFAVAATFALAAALVSALRAADGNFQSIPCEV